MSTTWRLILVGMAGLLTNSACTLQTNPYPSAAQLAQPGFRQAYQECQEDYPQTASGVHLRQWQHCMQLKGWK